MIFTDRKIYFIIAVMKQKINLKIKKHPPYWADAFVKCRRRPIFPGGCPPSIFGTNELNYCVRNGNRWTLIVINTD